MSDLTRDLQLTAMASKMPPPAAVRELLNDALVEIERLRAALREAKSCLDDGSHFAAYRAVRDAIEETHSKEAD